MVEWMKGEASDVVRLTRGTPPPNLSKCWEFPIYIFVASPDNESLKKIPTPHHTWFFLPMCQR